MLLVNVKPYVNTQIVLEEENHALGFTELPLIFSQQWLSP